MTPFAPNTEGIWFNLPAKDYHAAPGFSQSQAKHLNPPARWLQYRDKGPVDTEFTRMGSLVHQRLLEPSAPLPGFAVIPEKYPCPADSSLVKTKKAAPGDLVNWSWSAKYCQQWRTEQEAAGLEVIEAEELERLVQIIQAVAGNEDAASLIRGARTEVSCFWHVETAFGPVLCKTRQDVVMPPDHAAIVDAKVVQKFKADTEEFSRLILERGYHIQSAANLEGWNHFNPDDQKEMFVFVAVEREQPMPQFVNCVSVPEDVLRKGREEWRQAVETFARCQHEQRWPGYGNGIKPMILNNWDKRKFGI